MGLKRILHVMEKATPAGAAISRMVASLATAANEKDFFVQTCFLRPGGFLEQYKQWGIETTCVQWSGSAGDPLGTARFAAFLRSSEFSVIHLHTGGRFLTKMARFLTRARIVRHLHGRSSEVTGRVHEHISIPECDALIAVSRAVAESSRDARALVIHPGIDASHFSVPRKPHPGIVIGIACRLELIKGIKHLIDALASLAPEFSDLHLEIAGDGSLRSSLEGQCRDLGLSGKVSFLGWRDDLPSLMSSWDIFAIPSLDEGFPVAALEAMAAGLPVIASRVGGLCEMVQDGETGWLVSPGAPEDLAAKTRELIFDTNKRNQMGVAGRQRVTECFSESEMIAKTFSLYEKLLH